MKYFELKSFAKVQRHLNDSRIKTRRGNTWSRAGLSWMLRNHVYAGKTKVGADMIATHTPLVEPSAFEKVQEIMVLKKRNVDV